MRESEERTFATVAREVMGPGHSPAIIEAMATHAAELVKLRQAAAGNIVAIGTRINDCLYLIKDAIVAIVGDTLEARQDSANKLFTFLAKSAEISRSVARQYMRVAERFRDSGLDANALTIRDLFPRY